MRNLAAFIALLLFVGCFLIVMETDPSPTTSDGPVWRRTVDGWQLLDVSGSHEQTWAAHVHPALMAALIALLSCGALLLSEIHREQVTIRRKGQSSLTGAKKQDPIMAHALRDIESRSAA